MFTLKSSYSVFSFLYAKLLWNKNRTEKAIYLTFDDGPIPEITPWVLSQLKIYNAKATFFCIGDNVSKHPEVFQQILDNGHTVGNHTNNHLNGWKNKTAKYIENVSLADTKINSKLFRPPYGKITRKQINLLDKNYTIIMWDVLSYDFDASISGKKCADIVLKKAKNGSIIVFHDSLKAEKNLKIALPIVLHTLSDKGFIFKSL